MYTRKSKKKSVSGSLATDNCLGYLKDPLIEYRCQHVVRKWPHQLCGTLFQARQSQKEVCKAYCEKHRYCFLPLDDNKRCYNYRRSVNKMYCHEHVDKERQCASMINKYKRICGENPLSTFCTENDDSDTLETKRRFLLECFQKRTDHHRKCIHPSVQSLGHVNYIRNILKHETNCEKLLWHEAPEFNDDEQYLYKDDNLSDIFYDALENSSDY